MTISENNDNCNCGVLFFLLHKNKIQKMYFLVYITNNNDHIEQFI